MIKDASGNPIPQSHEEQQALDAAKNVTPGAPPPAKKVDERLQALTSLIKQYPGLGDMPELYKSDPRAFLKIYSARVIEEVSKQLDIPMSGVDILGGKPYINRSGLMAKVQKDPRQVVILKTVPVLYPMDIKVLNTPDDGDTKRYFIGCSLEGDAIYRGIVEFADGSRYEDEGHANAKYLTRQHNKMSSMIPYVMELASTRALNRAMRQATAMALVSTEELNERGISIVQEEKRSRRSAAEIKKTEHLQGEVDAAFQRLKFNEAKQLAWCAKFGDAQDVTELGPKDAEALLFALKEMEGKGE